MQVQWPHAVVVAHDLNEMLDFYTNVLDFHITDRGPVAGEGMNTRLRKDGRALKITPLTHGNTWSVYFSDPEGDGLKVFCDSPWHVSQPAGKDWDTAKSNTEIEAETRTLFKAGPSSGPKGRSL